MKNKKWYETNIKETMVEYNELEQTTVNFVDDSNSVITFEDPNKINFGI